MALFVAYRVQLAYWFVRRPTAASGHVAVWHAGRVLVVNNTYRRIVALPAGGLKRGEDPAAGACRELREEVGIALEPTEVSPAGVFTSRQHFKEDVAHVFEIELGSEPAVVVDRREVARAEFVAPDDLPKVPCCAVLLDYLKARGSG